MPDSYLKSLPCPVPLLLVSLSPLPSQVFPLVLPQGVHSAPAVSGTVLGPGGGGQRCVGWMSPFFILLGL